MPQSARAALLQSTCAITQEDSDVRALRRSLPLQRAARRVNVRERSPFDDHTALLESTLPQKTSLANSPASECSVSGASQKANESVMRPSYSKAISEIEHSFAKDRAPKARQKPPSVAPTRLWRAYLSSAGLLAFGAHGSFWFTSPWGFSANRCLGVNCPLLWLHPAGAPHDRFPPASAREEHTPREYPERSFSMQGARHKAPPSHGYLEGNILAGC